MNTCDVNTLSPNTHVWVYNCSPLGESRYTENQLPEVKSFCKQHGWITDRVFRDLQKIKFSGQDSLERMIALTGEEHGEAKIILVQIVCRLSKNLCKVYIYRDVLRGMGWQLIFVDDIIPDYPKLVSIVEEIEYRVMELWLEDLHTSTIRGICYLVESGCLLNARPVFGYESKKIILGGIKRDGSPRMGNKPVIPPDLSPHVKLAFE